MVQLTINGKTIEVPEGTSVLRAAESAGITIPTLCDHADLTPFGGCRMCVVEVKGFRTPMTSCTLQATQGMVVQTETPALIEARKFILEMLLSTYHDPKLLGNGDGAGDREAGKLPGQESQFLYWVNHYGLDPAKLMSSEPRYPVDSDPNPFVWVDLNKCIVCTRCVRACAEVQGRFVWNTAERGFNTHIVAGADTDMISARCESCGACVAYCPTGALSNKMSIDVAHPDRLVTTTCTYCGVGCNLDLNVVDDSQGGRVVRVTSNPNSPVNGMHLCVKGRYGYDFIHHEDRLTKPMVRQYLLDEYQSGSKAPRPADRGPWVETDWDTALEITASKLRYARDTYGADTVGILTSAKCLNEENYLMNKLARQVIGTNNIDHCARL